MQSTDFPAGASVQKHIDALTVAAADLTREYLRGLRPCRVGPYERTANLENSIAAYLNENWSSVLDGVDRAALAAGLSLHLEGQPTAACDHCVIIDGWCNSCGEPRTHAARLIARNGERKP